MGVFSVQQFMEGNDFSCREINIPELVARDYRNVIVVDGTSFINSYLYKKFPWIVCGTREYAECILDFVRTFQNLHIKLVFFFNENCVRDNAAKWHRTRKINVITSKAMLLKMEIQQPAISRTLSHDPPKTHDVMSWTISVLQDLNCDVICPTQDRLWHIANYARVNDCLAIFSQDSLFIFFENLNSLVLSFRHLDLENMKTKVYDKHELSWQLGLNTKLYPLLATFLGSSNKFINQRRKNVLFDIYTRSPVEGPDVVFTAEYIRENYDPRRLEDIPDIINKHFPLDAEWLKDQYSKSVQMFSLQMYETQNFTLGRNVSNKWGEIQTRCQELAFRGTFCGRIRLILDKHLFEQFPSLEDFKELPPSSLVYRKLRKNMYGILLHEKQGAKIVHEWCIETEHTPYFPVPVMPSTVNPNRHPGLLSLWDPSRRDGLSDKKWPLFAAAISPQLDYRLLQDIPGSLVVPVAVLYYLIQTLPTFTRGCRNSYLHPWEAEVFLVVALTLQGIDKDFLRRIPNLIGNVRAVRLANLFIQGCDITRMLVQSCGLFMGEIDASIWKYFDGKLFSHFYDEVLWGNEILDGSLDNLVQLSVLKTILLSAIMNDAILD